MTNSRAKGARGERYFANWLRENFGLKARRGQQYCGANGDADVVGGFPNTHCECKFVEKLNIQNAIEQAVKDCGDNIPYVAHKKNRSELLITIRAKDLKEFSKSVVSVLNE
jgi:hypothetical protein|tara:strand:+ start:1720 stop:2052 length:333 start_codon:yes stop_codon:yes gene_type:complete